MPGCCAVGCRNRSEDGKKLFCIPRGNENTTRRKIWLHRIARKDFTPTAGTRLCEDHFPVDQFEPVILANTGEKKLTPTAIPTIFSHRPPEKTRKPPAKRLRVDTIESWPGTQDANTFGDMPAASSSSEASTLGEMHATAQDSTTDMDHAANVTATDTSAISGSSAGSEHTRTAPSTHAALLKRIAQLEAEVQATRRKLQLAQKQRLQAIVAKRHVIAGVKKYLNEDQLKCLEKSTMKGTKWSKKTVTKALKVRLACGTRGYDAVRELGQPLPTERTLQRYLKGYKFEPGLLQDIIKSLALKVGTMSEKERHATLMLDEIQLAPGLVYDAASGSVTGMPTIPLADGTLPPDSLATHGLVFMLGGITTRWKQTIAYHLTGNSFHAETVKDVILLIIRECEAISLRIDVVVTDMGGGNQALWKLFGVVVGKHSKPKTWCLHPCDASRKLHFMADVPHLLKNLRSHLTSEQKIYLPTEVVKQHSLPGNEVSIEPIKKLVEIDSGAELKLAPHLKPYCVDPGHYDKMKVGPAFTVLNNDTGAALRLLVDNGTLEKSALTTAWFVETVFHWFRLMSSRTTKLALSDFHSAQRSKALVFLQDVIELFEKLSIGHARKTVWKPVQTGLILATTTALLVQELFLEKYDFKFLFLSRFSQDALENLFSTLRSKNPVPRVLEFKCALRAATVAQFLHPSKYGSYAEEDCFLLTGMSQDDMRPVQATVARPPDFLVLDNPEQESLQYLAGYVVSQVKKRNPCESCRAAITSTHLENKLTLLKSYNKENIPLSLPSPAVLQVIETAEGYVRNNQDNLIANKVPLAVLRNKVREGLLMSNCFPTCHNAGDMILTTFLRTRMHILVRKRNLVLVENANGNRKCGSRSLGMRAAASSIK